jgi:serine/threonine protein kinase/formylglycine-generating enzyme required for sulfatase activity/dienelactone hydrolase
MRDTANWDRVKELFQRALERTPAERSAFLREASGNNPALQAEVESLLAAHEGAETFAEGSPLDALSESAVASLAGVLQPGDRLGPYEIVSPIGAGGMGEVYRGRDTRLDRAVAIKIVSSTMADDPRWRERFGREARAVSALNHPHICTLHDVGHQNGKDFLVMEYLDGETLADRLHRGPLSLEETLRIAEHLADALDEAHRHGLIHRDIKPANIFLTTRGDAKILDFGLAKIALRAEASATAGPTTTELETLTEVGAAVGTAAYMSPEQMRGLPVDHRTDLFSFGLVLYEMVTSERPFKGSSAIAVADAIMHAPLRDFGDRPVPGQLKLLIRKLVEKDPANRYGSAEEVHSELRALEAALSPTRPARLSRNAWLAVGTALVLASAAVGWLWHRSSRERWALETAAPEIARLVDAGEFAKAAALTRDARAVLPTDPTLEKFSIRSTMEASLQSVPAGADVSIRPYREAANAWQTMGKTPVKVRLPRTEYIWKIAKPGFAPAMVIRGSDSVLQPGTRLPLDLTVKLRAEASVPPDMVSVPGGATWLGYPFGNAPIAQIEDYLIDRHEVTNEQYKLFVDAGGYQKREFWKEPFVRDGRTIPWEEAVAVFRDATGRPGPSTWEVGSYPNGLEKHPVAGVSWYEAAAYAEFAGRSLPTAYHWTRASQPGFTPLITAGSNFRGVGTQPVGHPGTLSGFGTVDMAGNVKEWCANEGRDGKRFILGGGFGEPPYMFNFTDAQLPWDRRANFGFRCVKLDSPPSAAAAARIDARGRDYGKEKPVSDDVFRAYSGLYAYDKGELDARVEETEASENWTREKVSFDAAYGHERVVAQLYLSRRVAPAFQVVVYFPGAFAMLDNKLDLSMVEDGMDFLMKSGRALMIPIYKGFYERRDGLVPGGKPPALFRDHVIMWSKDLGRSLDYLQTRPDIDGTKMAYLGLSLGGVEASIILAVEKRFKAAIVSSGGFQLRYDLPEVDPFNFVTRVNIPVLMLNGRYDDNFPLESSQLPFFHLLGTLDKNKKHVIYEATHANLPHREEVRESLDWLDKYLGPVRR